jgi:hypothetical protein
MADGDGGVRQKARFCLPFIFGLAVFFTTLVSAQETSEWKPQPGKEGTLYVHGSGTAVVVFIEIAVKRGVSLNEQLRRKWKGFTEADICSSLLKTPLRPGLIDGTIEATSMEPYKMCYAAAGSAKGKTYIVLAVEELQVASGSSLFAQSKLSKALDKKMPESPYMGEKK